jgi:hypothetical protein
VAWPRPWVESWLRPSSDRRRRRRRGTIVGTVVLPVLPSADHHRTPGASGLHRAATGGTGDAARRVLVLLPVAERLLSRSPGMPQRLDKGSATPLIVSSETRLSENRERG